MSPENLGGAERELLAEQYRHAVEEYRFQVDLNWRVTRRRPGGPDRDGRFARADRRTSGSGDPPSAAAPP